MYLLDLPAEVLAQIFSNIDPSFFRSDLSRLTINKHWYDFARTAAFGELLVTEKSLERIFASPELPSLIKVLQKNCRSLNFKLVGFNGWHSHPMVASMTSIEQDKFWNTPQGDKIQSIWQDEFRGRLYQLVAMIPKLPRYDSLHVKAINTRSSYFSDMEGSYLERTTLNWLISAKTLTILDLDIQVNKAPMFDPDSELQHICVSIASHLFTLHELRLRTWEICSAALILPDTSATKLALHTVLIHVSGVYSDGQNCHHDPEPDTPLKKALIRQARKLVDHMAKPKMVRIMTSDSFSEDFCTGLDVLTGRVYALDEKDMDDLAAEGRELVRNDSLDDEDSGVIGSTSVEQLQLPHFRSFYNIPG